MVVQNYFFVEQVFYITFRIDSVNMLSILSKFVDVECKKVDEY